MRRLAPLCAFVLLLLSLSACGSDDEPDGGQAASPEATASAETSESAGTSDSPASPASPAGGQVPSYEEVKALWLANTSAGDRESCETGTTEDKQVGSPDGEYVRFVCNGIARFTYAVGAETYADNFASASSDLVGRAVFHVPGEAFVVTSGANEQLAPAIKAACGCGEVLGPQG